MSDLETGQVRGGGGQCAEFGILTGAGDAPERVVERVRSTAHVAIQDATPSPPSLACGNTRRDPKPRDAKATAKRGPAPKLQQQMDRITQLPRARQQFVMQVIDSVLAQAGR